MAHLELHELPFQAHHLLAFVAGQLDGGVDHSHEVARSVQLDGMELVEAVADVFLDAA